MAVHNFELGDLVTGCCKEMGVPPKQSNWHLCYGFLGMDGYTLSDPSHVRVLNDKIIKHYWFHELAVSPPGRFAFYMDEALNLIMPYYDGLYKSEIQDAAVLFGATYEEALDVLRSESVKGGANEQTTGTATATSQSDGSSTDHEEASGNSLMQRLDTPQGEVALIDSGYMTSLQKDSGTTTSDSNGTASSTVKSDSTSGGTKTSDTSSDTEERRGESRTWRRTDPEYARLVLDLGRRFMNIDRMVVEDREIRECFWCEWDY